MYAVFIANKPESDYQPKYTLWKTFESLDAAKEAAYQLNTDSQIAIWSDENDQWEDIE